MECEGPDSCRKIGVIKVAKLHQQLKVLCPEHAQKAIAHILDTRKISESDGMDELIQQ